LKCFYLDEFKIENYEKENEDYDYWHKKFLKEKLNQHHNYLLLNSDDYSPPPLKGYSDSIFSTTSTLMLPQPLHELKPFSRKKPKLKYETLDDVGSEISIFINIRN
jgi:hypothetical protein